jgi:hypothetical protein
MQFSLVFIELRFEITIASMEETSGIQWLGFPDESSGKGIGPYLRLTREVLHKFFKTIGIYIDKKGCLSEGGMTEESTFRNHCPLSLAFLQMFVDIPKDSLLWFEFSTHGLSTADVDSSSRRNEIRKDRLVWKIRVLRNNE